MKTLTAVLSILLVLVLVISAYLLFRPDSGRRMETQIPPDQSGSQSLLQAPPSQEQQPSATPLPPPRISSESPNQLPAEPERKLAGVTAAEIKRIEMYLPKGSQIATYPVSENSKSAATASADINNDGVTETVVVYSSPEKHNSANIASLYVAILEPSQEGLIVRASTLLSGAYIQNNILRKKSAPFALRDIIGTGRKEILVTSSVGASLGSVLEVFSFEKSSLRQIAAISGDIIEVQSTHENKPSLIVVRSRDGEQIKSYRWNGFAFQS